jgi:short-subunit dehydrogenase
MEDSRLAAGRKIMSAAKVAERGYKGLMAGKTIIVPGVGNKFVAEAPRLGSRRLVTAIAKMVQDRRG